MTLMDLLSWIWDESAYVARWHCGAPSPWVGWLQIGADLLTAASYGALAGMLLYWRRTHGAEDRFLRFTALAFACFILAGGTAHLLDALMWWWPRYNALAVCKALMAAVSLATAGYVLGARRHLGGLMSTRAHHEHAQEIQALHADQMAESHAQGELWRVMFEGVFNSAPLLLNAWDNRGRAILWNPECERLLGYTLEELNTTPDIHEVFYPNKEDARLSELHVREASGKFALFAVHNRAGEVRHQLWANFRVDGAVVGVGLDVTEDTNARHKLEAALEALKHSNHELQNFTHAASHDLQEPLRKFRQMNDRARSNWNLFQAKVDAHDPEGAQMHLDRVWDSLDRAENAALRMTTLLNSLLELSREIRNDTDSFQAVDVRAATLEAVDTLSVLIEETRGKIELVGDTGSIFVQGSHEGIVRLMANLLSNGLKFVPPREPPHIVVRLESVGTRTVKIEVTDHGIGFAPEQSQAIFDAFKRLHPRSRYEGTGLGLAICRKVVQRHRGTIRAESTPGEGARFTILLPTTPGSAPEPPP